MSLTLNQTYSWVLGFHLSPALRIYIGWLEEIMELNPIRSAPAP